jgi:excisionase family DNA binding protein
MTDGRLVTVQEMALILNVPVSWLYQRTRLGSKAIPHLKLGKYVRFNPEEVKEFFKNQRND